MNDTPDGGMRFHTNVPEAAGALLPAFPPATVFDTAPAVVSYRLYHTAMRPPPPEPPEEEGVQPPVALSSPLVVPAMSRHRM